jgi:hypothetical protein
MFMVFISRIVMNEPIELDCFRIGLFGMVSESLFFFCNFFGNFVAIADKIAASQAVMLFPRFQAHPAEVVLALGTSYMVAALVFLYGRLAMHVRTTLGIRNKPKVVG